MHGAHDRFGFLGILACAELSPTLVYGALHLLFGLDAPGGVIEEILGEREAFVMLPPRRGEYDFDRQHLIGQLHNDYSFGKTGTGSVACAP